MTRINVGIDPTELPNKLLLAEHREITRIPNAVKSGRAIVRDLPDKFVLGKGHVKFFYNKLLFLEKRYQALFQECLRRGFDVTDKSSAFVGIPQSLFNNYDPTQSDRALIEDRIAARGFALLTQ